MDGQAVRQTRQMRVGGERSGRQTEEARVLGDGSYTTRQADWEWWRRAVKRHSTYG